MGFPGGSDGKESGCNAGDLGSILQLVRAPEGGHGNPLQYSCLENPHGQRSLAGYSLWGCKESDTTEQLSLHSIKCKHVESIPTLKVKMLVTQSCPTLCDPMDCSLSGSSAHGDSPGKNTGMCCQFLLQGIFPTQGSKPGLLHCWSILYHLSHQRSLQYLRSKPSKVHFSCMWLWVVSPP